MQEVPYVFAGELMLYPLSLSLKVVCLPGLSSFGDNTRETIYQKGESSALLL